MIVSRGWLSLNAGRYISLLSPIRMILEFGVTSFESAETGSVFGIPLVVQI